MVAKGFICRQRLKWAEYWEDGKRCDGVTHMILNNFNLIYNHRWPPPRIYPKHSASATYMSELK